MKHIYLMSTLLFFGLIVSAQTTNPTTTKENAG
jgi:hypothetical protein